MLLPQIETTEANQMDQLLLEPGESLQFLQGSKSQSTTSWDEPLKGIGSDLSAQLTDGPFINANENQGTRSREYWQKVIQGLEGELVAFNCHYEAVQAERKDKLNKLLDLKENIRIFCRMRPFLPNDRWPLLGPILIPETATVHTLKCGQKKNFQLDRVFLPNSSQDEVFSEIGPLVRSAMEGQNVCIFAYGQTGSGKTFTMEGTKDHPGVVPRALQQVFLEASLDSAATFRITFSMLEIYRGQLRDLFVKSSGKSPQSGVNCNLSIQMGARGSVEVENLTQVQITSPTEALHLYEKAVSLRSTSWTNSNETSSRSHCLLRIIIEKNHGQRDLKMSMSKLWLIDLGGSERFLKTKAQGQTLEEGKAMNMSLSALGDVISALHRKKHHVPYRNSKLTQVLQDSLARSSKTLMLVHISPRDDDLGETICSLGFASRARAIHLGHELSSEAGQQKEVALAELVDSLKNLDEKIQNMRTEIEILEQLIQSRKHFITQDKTLEEEEERHLVFTEEDSKQKSSKFLDIHEFKPKCVSSIPRFMNPTLSSAYKKRLSVDNMHSAGPDNKIRRRRHSFSCVTDMVMKETEVKSSRTERVKVDDTRKFEGKQQYRQKLNTSSAILFEEVIMDSTVTRLSSKARILQRIDLNHSYWR